MTSTVRQKNSIVMLTQDRQIDRRILLQADSLEAAGWEVIIIAMPLDVIVEDDPRVVRIGNGQAGAARENFVLSAYRWIRGLLPMNGYLMRLIKRFAWQYFVDQEIFFSRLFYSTASRYSPAVFVAHDLPMLPLASNLALKQGAKLVYDSHELYSEQEFSTKEKKRWAQIEEKYISTCDAIITVNQSIASELEQRYGVNTVEVIFNAERCVVPPIKNRVFHELFQLSPDKKILLLQGGLSSGRNLDILVDAIHHVKNENVILVMLGDGALLNKLKSQANNRKLSDRVFFHPAVPQNKLLTYTAAADVGIIPYQATCLNNYFCTPNKLFEFIAAEIPVVATNLPEISNIVEKYKIGLVGDTSSPEKIAMLIDDYFDNTQFIATCLKNIIAARQQVCWEVEEKKLVRIYETLR